METVDQFQAVSVNKENVANEANKVALISSPYSPVKNGRKETLSELDKAENKEAKLHDSAANKQFESKDSWRDDSSAEESGITKGSETQVDAVVVEERTDAINDNGRKEAAGNSAKTIEAKEVTEISQINENHKNSAENTTCNAPPEEILPTVSLSIGAQDTTRENRNESTEEMTNIIDDFMVDNVNDPINCVGTESVPIPKSPVVSHLSEDEVGQLLQVHQGEDDQDLFLEHDAGADADVEAEPTHLEHQWFKDVNEDEAALEASSILDVTAVAVDDVFGLDGSLDFPDTTPKPACLNSDESGDTLVVPNSSSPSSGPSSSSGSSSPSLTSIKSSSEDETARLSPKKRRRTHGPRQSRKFTQQKRVRSPEGDQSITGHLKRKRKIPNPVIPSEFAVFEAEATDPILKGSYSVRTNRRAYFHGNWGFSDDAFNNSKSISPFEYSSHVRVPQSRSKDDKRPVSGKYGGFFKLRQFNGKLVKIREDQLDLEFLPMPSSSGEDEDEDEDVENLDVDDGIDDEPAASRYAVLGKGKNRYGRFLIRGYLDPESGRLNVKRRYLE